MREKDDEPSKLKLETLKEKKSQTSKKEEKKRCYNSHFMTNPAD